MEIINILFQSGEIIKKRVKEIEQKNIPSLRETQEKIETLLRKATKGTHEKTERSM